MGASTDARRRPVSHRRSSNRTCPIKASGFPTVFTVDSRTIAKLHLTKPEHPPVAKDRLRREAIDAARLHLVAPPQEMPYALIDVVVNRPIRCRPGPVAEVCRPASQNLIQPIPHLQPCPRIAGYQMVSHFLLDARYALLGRTGSHVPTACLLIALWPERVTQKVEAFFGGLFDAGFRLIQSESQPCDHLPRPTQCLVRFSTAENHEIVRIGDHPGLELLPPFGILPTLQQTVHV